MRKYSFLLIGICFLLQGCSDLGQTASPTEPKQPLQTPQRLPDSQRFVPISPPAQLTPGIPWHGSVALDTKTGQLCKTFEWETTEIKMLNKLPACFDLNTQDRVGAPLTAEDQYQRELLTDDKLYRSIPKGNEDLFEPVYSKSQNAETIPPSWKWWDKPAFFRLKALRDVPPERQEAYRTLLQQRQSLAIPQVNAPGAGRYTATPVP